MRVIIEGKPCQLHFRKKERSYHLFVLLSDGQYREIPFSFQVYRCRLLCRLKHYKSFKESLNEHGLFDLYYYGCRYKIPEPRRKPVLSIVKRNKIEES